MASEAWRRGWDDAAWMDAPWQGNFVPDEDFGMEGQKYLTGFAARKVLQPKEAA